MLLEFAVSWLMELRFSDFGSRAQGSRIWRVGSAHGFGDLGGIGLLGSRVKGFGIQGLGLLQ